MARIQQRLAVSERTAAEMLDLAVKDFRRLVSQGALPGPFPLGDLPRWWVADLDAIRTGNASRPADDDFSM